MEITAAGIEVANVNPALSPKKTLAAVNISVVAGPSTRAAQVSSLRSGMPVLPSIMEVILMRFSWRVSLPDKPARRCPPVRLARHTAVTPAPYAHNRVTPRGAWRPELVMAEASILYSPTLYNLLSGPNAARERPAASAVPRAQRQARPAMANNHNGLAARTRRRAAASGFPLLAAAAAAPRFAALVWFAAAPMAFSADDPDQTFAIHGQATYVEQEAGSFAAPYAGANSLSPDHTRETTDSTLFIGARLWAGAEAWISPEIDQGFGLDATLGAAGFPSAEAYKIGRNSPYLRLPRVFVRETLNLGPPTETVEADQMQLAGLRSSDRWGFTVGKFGVTDVFDTNQYAHDPRGDFLNWAAVDAGTFDYAADSWGYTVGATAERYQGAWTLRAGLFDLSDIPNSAHLEP